ncbi:ribbon-helix-helix protein, CopG family [Bradyrhizobium sp. AUGA SZCCT0042]|uniref:ribbon-helix-helix protein, CopG family n=1 Tax=Bradyrhizobium sp. AUGA SZCCT0042 TaxID=2807651 RepID=UPI001BAE45CA|nr:ribbon-helix-helix protein, CopG family [Bradyrhizobium sp. AUGA SZCCT0042]MBR1298550.1 hypothetical protein [Bradyrhizobium sp. AUGA SZCCT0042]
MVKPRKEARMQVWVTREMLAAFERLSAEGELSLSDHIRFALSNHLRHFAITAPATPRPIQNGHQHRVIDHGG